MKFHVSPGLHLWTNGGREGVQSQVEAIKGWIWTTTKSLLGDEILEVKDVFFQRLSRSHERNPGSHKVRGEGWVNIPHDVVEGCISSS